MDTGELAYKPVIGRTVRPPSPILQAVGSTVMSSPRRAAIRSGSPASAGGWPRSLSDGAILHGVTARTRVDGDGIAGEEEAYNLVVADFNTYFVGESGVLVHDNTPRTPTR